MRTDLAELCSGLSGIKDDPVKMEILHHFLEVLKTHQEGQLTPEGERRLSNLKEFVQCLHRLYIQTPKPSPEEAQRLQDRIKELEDIGV